jgi:hypothetical protein
MTRYADPQRCPDCGASITPGAESCTSCRLPLRGTTAQQLFTTLARADELLTALRAASPTPAAAGAPAPAPSGSDPRITSTRRRRSGRPARAHGRLSAATVPKILLTLGAGCLLVAALVFLAVTWSVMGVGGRTLTLVALTVVCGVVTGWMARRGLRAAAESLSLVTYGLVALDVVGADNAGWFGGLSTSALLVLVGTVLAVAGVGGAIAARGTAVGVLTGAEVVAALGAGVAALGTATSDSVPVGAALVLATLLGAAATCALLGLRLHVAGAGATIVTGGAWTSLTGYAVQRTLEHDSWSALWGRLEVWPLVVAAVLVALLAVVRRLPVAVAVASLAVAQLLLVLAVLAPVLRFDPTPLTLVGLGVLAVAALVTWLLPRPWGLVSVLTQAAAGCGVVVAGGRLATAAASRVAEVVADPFWSGRATDLLPVRQPDLPAAWLLPLCVLALVLTGWSLTRASEQVDDVLAPVADLRLGAAVLAASLVAVLALHPVPVWLVVAALVVVAAGFTAWWTARPSAVPLALATLFATTATALSLHAEWLTVAALAGVLALTGLVHLRHRASDVASGAGAALTVTLGALVWAVGAALDAEPTWVALVGLLLLGAVALAAPYAPDRWWASLDPVVARDGSEAGAGLGAAVLGLLGVSFAPFAEQSSWAAVYLTVAGVLVTVMSLLRSDRRRVSWVGGLLLAAASWVRLWEVGVRAPEAYTLPSALVLLLVGLVHLRRSPLTSTMAALSSGLSLALVPSLLWVLEEPTGARALLLGLACLLLVMVGARLGWTAPIALGATVGALVVLRLAAPYVGDSVPRWVLIGGAGALLVTVGATWERRLQEARQVVGYVRALR